jgi:hypothetical protein
MKLANNLLFSKWDYGVISASHDLTPKNTMDAQGTPGKDCGHFLGAIFSAPILLSPKPLNILFAIKPQKG